MTKWLIEFLAVLFILLFVYTAYDKLTENTRFAGFLQSAPLLTHVAGTLRWLVPGAELAVALLLVLPEQRLWGFLGSLLLMLLFTGYTGVMLLLNTHRPCRCGGILTSLSWPQHFRIDCLLAVLATAGFVLVYRHKHFIAINREGPTPERKPGPLHS